MAYRTVAGVNRLETDKVKRSRFIATVFPVRSEADVTAQVERLRQEFSEANHHCWAYRLGEGSDVFRYSDDGEPSGSAGRPILQRIDGQGLTDTAVVVTRIFGGTKLGVGGLVRAYGGAAAAALEAATIREVIPVHRVRLTYPLALSRKVESILKAADVAPGETTYTSTVQMHLEIPEEQAPALLEELRERTSGRIVIQPEEQD